MTLDIAANRYFEEVGKFQASHQTTEYQLRNLCIGIGRAKLLSEIDSPCLTEYVAKRRAKVSDSSVNRELELLRRLMRRADEIWKVSCGETINWGGLMLREPEGRMRELSQAEEEKLFACLRQDLHPLVRFCMVTGIRLTNAITLTWPQVDFDAGVIRLMVKSIKPGGETHHVPLIASLVALLSAERGNHETFVFTYACVRGRGGRKRTLRYPLTSTGWRKAWRKALTDAGISDFRFHDLRHTAATRTLRASQNLKVTQTLLGHRDIASTARYAHAMLDDVKAAMDAAVDASASRNSPKQINGKNTKALKSKK